MSCGVWRPMPDERTEPSSPANERLPPSIRPSVRSVSMAPGDSEPPVFEVAAGGARSVWLEVSTNPGLFQNVDTPKGLFFSSREGSEPLGIPPAKPVPVREGDGVTYYPNRLSLDRRVWDAIRARRDVTCLYYRVVGLGPNGESLRWCPAPHGHDGPFLHVRHGALAPLYEPPQKLPALPRLRVRGPNVEQITGQSSKSVRLCGLNLPFFLRKPWWGKQRETRAGSGQMVESVRWHETAAITKGLCEQIARDWQANVIRLTLNEDWILHGVAEFPGEFRRCVAGKGVAPKRPKLAAIEYLLDLDEIIRWAGSAGLYVILSMTAHRLCESVDKKRNYDAKPYLAPMPAWSTAVAWDILAGRYRKAPWVLFEPFNEPHPWEPIDKDDVRFALHHAEYPGPRPDPTKPGAPARVDEPEGRKWWVGLWQDWARYLTVLLRQTDPGRVVMISGIGGPNWSASLREMPFERVSSLGNIVYSAHIYCLDDQDPNRGADCRWKERPSTHQGCAADREVVDWLTTRGKNKSPADVPVFVAEWGPKEWPWQHGQGDLKAPPCMQWQWAGDQRKRTENLRDALGNLLTVSPKRLPAIPLVGWAAWSINGLPPLNTRRSVQVSAYNPNTGACQSLAVEILDDGPCLSPWGRLVKDELVRLKKASMSPEGSPSLKPAHRGSDLGPRSPPAR